MAGPFRAERAAFVAAACAMGLLAGCFGKFEGAPPTGSATRPPGARSVPSAPPAEILPLQPGARFDYGARYGLGAGQFTGTAMLSVVDAWLQGDRETARVIVRSAYAGRVRHDEYLFAREGGWIGMVEKPAPALPTWVLPTRMAVGDRWPVKTGEGDGSATAADREDVVTPAGRFKGCYRVVYTNDKAGTNWVLWLAPAVGLVQADITMHLGPVPLHGRLWLESLHPPVAALPLGTMREVARAPGEQRL